MSSNDSHTPVWTFAGAALILGLLYAVLVPPFCTPDEQSHFARSWSVSRGHLFAVRQGSKVGYLLPPEFTRLFNRFPIPQLDPARVAAALHDPPAGADQVFASFPGHAVAPVVLYVAQGLAIAVARAAHAAPIVCFYAGRLLNLLAGVVLVALAIRFLPSYRWFTALIALTPMANHLRASLSGDVVTLGIAFLFTALVARALFVDEPLSAGRWAAIAVLGALLCLTKVVYIPLAMLPLIVPQRRFAGAAAAWRARAVHAAAAIAGAVLSSAIASVYWAPFREDVPTPGAQIHYIAAHPLTFAKILFAEYVLRAKWYLISMVGDLGMGDDPIVLPRLLVVLYFACLLALVVWDTNRRVDVTPLQRLYFAAVCAATAFAVAFAIYTTWNPVGWPRIDGLQGRYYLPFVPAAAFIAHRASDGLSERWRMAIVLAAVIIANAIALHMVVTHWYAGGWHGLTSAWLHR